MRFATAFVAAAAAAGAVAQTTYTVLVGQNESLLYNPPSISGVNVGDTVRFQFLAKNHTVTQSTFAAPCANITTPVPGIDSGFMFVANTSTTFPVWSITVNNASAPLWFHCRQTNPESHCAAGMVFAINPTAAKSYDQFLANAKASTSSAASTSGANGATNTAAGTGGDGASPASTGSASGTLSTGSSSGTASSPSSTSGAGRTVASAGLLLTGLAAGLLL
jgi:plastocyanin